MDILELVTDDYSLLIVTKDLYNLYSKASQRITNITKSTFYNFSSGYNKFQRVKIENNSSEKTTITPGAPAPPLFFENKDYLIEIEFQNSTENPRVYSKREAEQGNFINRQRHGYQVLTRNINFQNDIGRYELIIRYTKNERSFEDIIHFEVFPTKLDYKHDYHQILRDINREYAYLVLDYFKKTYSNFTSSKSSSNDLIWWQIFGTLYHEIIESSRLILYKPHNRLIRRKTYKKADRIKKLSPILEEKIAEHRNNHSKFYPITEKINSIDTVENRFVKHALSELANTFNRLQTSFLNTFGDQLTEEFRKELFQISSTFDEILHMPFFRKVGEFSGFKQESLVMQNKPGYASLFRNWIILKKGIDFYKGIQQIELKNIAQLYQIWCFIGVKNMVQEIVDNKPDDITLAKTILEKFNIIIKKGDESRITFTQKNGEKIELIHEYSAGKGTGKSVQSYTVLQQPDIMLKIKKNDLKEDYTFTYLFDAKYRLEDRLEDADLPPSDSINQMHRYRDSIYYREQKIDKKGKEIIGGYVLYPGTGSYNEYLNSSYIKSIEEVNIGAFPLRPNDTENSKLLLKNHLKSVIQSNSENILKEVIPQKEYSYKEFNPHVLVGIVPTNAQMKYLKTDSNPVYHTRLNPQRFGYDKLQYFAPYRSGRGIDLYFKIEDYTIKQRDKVFPKKHPLYKNDTRDYLVIKLGKKQELPQTFKTADGSIGTFRYTNLYNIKNPTRNKIEMI